MQPEESFAQWFDDLGKCRTCGKPATGTLRSFYCNASLGAYCTRHAEQEIKRAHKLGKFEPDAHIRPTDAA